MEMIENAVLRKAKLNIVTDRKFGSKKKKEENLEKDQAE